MDPGNSRCRLRARTPIARLAISRAAISGSASSSPAENSVDDQIMKLAKPPACMGVAETGNNLKLSASTCRVSRWPFMARKISVVSRPRNSESTGVWPAFCGS